MKKVLIVLSLILTMAFIGVMTIGDSDGDINIKSSDVSKFGITITKCHEKTSISKKEAIKIAQSSYLNKSNSEHIKAQLNNMTYLGYVEDTPVWIISFKGDKIVRTNSFETQEEDRSKSSYKEQNIVVDATSGMPIFAFSFR